MFEIEYECVWSVYYGRERVMMATLKSKLRGRLMSSHGARKNTRNALWIVYSPKSKTDLSLASNNECVYWVANLEANPTIRSFKFGYEAELKLQGEDKFRNREFIRVELNNGEVQVHTLCAGDGGIDNSTITLRELFAGRAVVEARQVTFVKVHADYLRQQAQKATRTLRLIGFASQIRGCRHDVTSGAVELAILSLKVGTVEQILLATSRHDPMVVLGVFAEKVLTGGIEIDLTERAFGNHSHWKLT
jgi:hypothetical protein